MVIYVDIDNTICNTPGCDYSSAVPIMERIQVINSLYDEGHEMVYYTARGSLNVEKREEFRSLTLKQLREWGCKFHRLDLGNKPVFDLLIDDRAINSEFYFKKEE